MLLSLFRQHALVSHLLKPDDEEADLHTMGRENVQALAAAVTQCRPSSSRGAAEHEALTLGLQALAEQCEPDPMRPLLPSLRDVDYFDVEEEVVIVATNSLFSRKCQKLVAEKLLLAYVIPDIRSDDGVVSAVTRQRTHSHAYGGGRQYSAGVTSGSVIKRADLPQLQRCFASKSPQDKRFARLWLRHCGSKAIVGYAAALRSQAVHGAA